MELSLTIAFYGAETVVSELERLATIHRDNAAYTINRRAAVAATGAAKDCEAVCAAIQNGNADRLSVGAIAQLNTVLARLAR